MTHRVPLKLGFVLAGLIVGASSSGLSSDSTQIAEAKLLIAESRFSEALKILESVASEPTGPPIDAYYHLAVCHARLGAPEVAIENLDIVLEADASHLPALHLKAYLRFAEGNYGEALRWAREFLAQRPTGAETRKISGLALFMLGDKVGAERDLRRAAELLPKDFDAHYYLGRIYFEQSKLTLALDTFRRALALNPQSVRAHNHLGQTLEGLTRLDAAMSAYQSAIRVERHGMERSEWPYYNLGSLVLSEGDAPRAVALLEQALERNRSSVQTRTKLGVALSAASRLDAAAEHLRAAVEAEPHNSDAHYQLGRVLMKLGNSDEGRWHLSEFERLREP